MLTAQIAPSCAIPIMELSICPNRKNHLMRQKFLFLLACLLLFSAMSIIASAQLPLFDRSQTVRDMLTFVPLDQERPEFFNVSYINYTALQSVNGVTIDPGSSIDFENLSDDEQRAWIRRARRWSVGPQFVQYMLVSGQELLDYGGFDAFAVNQAVAFGNPPENGIVLQTDDTLAAFESAHRARNYTQTDINGLTAWCSEDGCDSGMQQDLQGRQPGYVFDPSGLGRQPPVLVTDAYYASAFSLDVLENMADSFNGDAPSFLDVPEYAAVTDALIDASDRYGELLQFFMPPISEYYTVDFTAPDPYATVNPRSESDTVLDSWADYGALPQWSAVMLADYADEGTNGAILALAYDNQTDAQHALDEVSQRVLTFTDEIRTRGDQPLIEIVEGGATLAESSLYEAEDGYFVAVIALTYPEPTPDSDEFSGALFIRWMNALYARTFDVLWNIIPPEE